MPMTTTHALVPIAVAVAVADRPVPWRVILVASLAAALPDADWIVHHFFRSPYSSIYSHRGAAHSLFAALLVGCVASLFHRWLGIRPLLAGVLISASMASHGALDMMTDAGRGVAYLWPLSSVRLFADWRWIHSGPLHFGHLLPQAIYRLKSELWQLIVPMFAIALAVRGARALAKGRPGSTVS